MERWTFFRDPMSSYCACGMKKDIAGDWVDYDDHVEDVAKLEAENRQLKNIARDYYRYWYASRCAGHCDYKPEEADKEFNIALKKALEE